MAGRATLVSSKRCMRKSEPNTMAHEMEPKTAILFINLYAEMGGGEVAIYNQLKSLDRARFRPVMMFNRHGAFVEQIESLGVETVFLAYETVMLSRLVHPARLWRLFVASGKMYGYVKRNRTDVIHCSDVLSLLLIAVSVLRFRIAVLYSVIFFYERARMIVFNVLAIILVRSIVTNSSLVREDLLRGTLFIARKILTVYPGVDMSTFRPRRDSETKEFRNELRVPSEAKLICMVGRYDPWKGHKIFLEAASLVSRERRDVMFVIIGGALFADVFPFFKDYYNDVVEYAHQRELKDIVIFLPHRDDIPEVMRSLDVLVLPSISEPFGLLVLEALASGVPVVVSRTVGALEVVRDVPGVYVAERADPDSFADRIIEALDASAEKDTAPARRAVETVLNKLSWNEHARRMERIYASLEEPVTP